LRSYIPSEPPKGESRMSRPQLLAGEVCQLTGISYKQLDHWVRTGLVPLENPTPGHGYRRLFDEAAVARVREIANLRRRVADLRQQQGLPPTVEDASVVREVAGMLRRGVE
jgi:predicted site-specific integrase-resolvase